MSANRRSFLKWGGLASLSLIGARINTYANPVLDINHGNPLKKEGAARFNMCNYTAPKMDNVRVGIIGIGNRGKGFVARLSKIDGVTIQGLSDIVPSRVEEAKSKLDSKYNRPVSYTKSADDWKNLCDRNDIDLIYVATPWALHTPMAVYAMEQGKHVCVEVPAATSIEESWQLVETSERTKKHCMMLENCCYDFFELLTLNMARQGFFGEIIHGEGAYIHDLYEGNFSRKKYDSNMWRLKENASRNGNLYPTHGLGPICQIMNINRGDQFDYMVSMSTNDFMLGNKAEEMAAKDDFFKEYVGKPFRGNMNTSTIRTKNGKTIMLQHDVTSPRPYSRIHLISGTKGFAQKYPLPGRIAISHNRFFNEKEMKEVEDRYTPDIVRKMGEIAQSIGGHGGMDFLMDWRTIDCIRNGLPLDQDVYDAAAWSSIMPLSAASLKNRSGSVDIPDFTRGNWKTNVPLNLSLEKGGTTKLRGK
ncbi:Gfo/Idh/MocA family protein [Pseudopedobacter beijingensis]|uniref:Gfo/Idh/MocA family protein n=1 Tax=Pseudopedobacter beijingensis TaxID=1207056 RepID=A0ABW4IEY0_9SPHI